jgi:2-polyprenyl-6-methoxyphenol hydroxylase-like FAD-dependent oxidoreductase
MTGAPRRVQCCIAGGGPAGLMLGLLLARAGVSVAVLEKHADFLRDFRGDTIHPSTLEVMAELGLLDELLTLPHQKVAQLGAQVGDTQLIIGDFSRLPTRCKFIAFMPQWDFLNMLARHGARYPGFSLMMQTKATDLIREGGKVSGVRAKTQDGRIEIAADLVVAADGRHSTLRAAAGLPVEELGAPIDVLWFRMPRGPDDPAQSMGRFAAGGIFVMIDRGDYWQCGLVIAKGGYDLVRAAGLPALHDKISRLAPFLADRVAEIKGWEQVKLLTVQVDRLTRWHQPGFLCIGDAAHAMSPIGGVGINLAIQDAVAAANRLAVPLRESRVTEADLEAVQRRRMFPTRVTQRLQLTMQNRIIAPLLRATEDPKPSLGLRIMAAVPLFRQIPARVIGLGVRPEHVQTPEVRATLAAAS